MNRDLQKIALLISESSLSIYDKLEPGHELWLTSDELQDILTDKMIGISLSGLALRTRSKFVKTETCKALGYPIPKSFKKTQPRFPGQNFDVYTQKSNNLQVWNEELDQDRRYVIFGVSKNDDINFVKVINGAELADLDTTGTLTHKYQARLTGVSGVLELVSEDDTPYLSQAISSDITSTDLKNLSPADGPKPGYLLPIKEIFSRLQKIVGSKFPDPGIDQERNRGGLIHSLACKALGYSKFEDNGRFPDIFNQLLEIKLQTSPTVDLGLVTPDSESKIDMNSIDNIYPRHCDVRYALFIGKTDGINVEITNLIVTNGFDFFSRMPRFEGNVLNKKLQIRLPFDFFNN